MKKTHILFLSFTALLLTACASKEQRMVSETEDTPQEELQYSKYDTNSGRDVGGRDIQ